MKKTFFIILLSLCGFVFATAQNTVSVSMAEGVPGEVVDVDVILQNSDEVTAAEVIIPLVGKQVTYVDGSCVMNSERSDGHQLNVAVVDGKLRVYIYSYPLSSLKGNDGNLFSFSVKLGKTPGEYTLQPEVILSDTQGNSLQLETSSGAVMIIAPQIEVVTPVIDFGHVPICSQYQGTLTLRNSGTAPLEVTGITVSGGEFNISETVFTIAAGETKDVRVDFSPTVRGAVEGDVTVISDATNGSVTASLVADPYSVNELHCGSASGIAGEEVTVGLVMNNMEPIVGMQVTFNLPVELEYVDGSFLAAERAWGHTASATCKDGKLTLLLFSSRNEAMSGDDGVVASFRLRLKGYSGSYYITPENTVLSNAALENMVSAVSGEYVTISSPAIGGEDELDMGRSPVTGSANAGYSVRNNGNSPLVINSVAFLSSGYKVNDELPVTVEPYSSVVLDVEYIPVGEGEHSTTMNVYSNDPVNKLKSVRLFGTVYEPNELSLSGENLENGDYRISVALDNYTAIVALQMDIHWMSGMVTSTELLEVAGRLGAHSCSVTRLDEDSYRFVAFSLNNKVIEGNSGKLFDLTFQPDGDVGYKDTQILVDNVVLSNDKASNYASIPGLSATASFRNYFVRFICDGEVIHELFLAAGSAVTPAEAPEKEGYLFMGWNGLPETMPASDVEVTAVYRPVEVAITIGQYGSTVYCPDYALDFSGVDGLKAYAATGYNTSTGIITMTRVNSASSGVGLYLKGEPGEYTVPVVDAADDNSLNMLAGAQVKTVVNSTSDDGTLANYKYTIKAGDPAPMFYRFSDGSSVSAGKAYLQIPVEWLDDSPAMSACVRFDDACVRYTDAQETAGNGNCITITIGQYGSTVYCPDYALDFSGVDGLKAYAATGYNTSTGIITMTRVNSAASGVGLYLKGEPGEYTVPVVDAADDNSLNMLAGALVKTVVNSTSDDGALANYKYTIKAGDPAPMFYRFSDGSSVSAGKAYLQIPVVWLQSDGAKSVGVRLDEDVATDVHDVVDDAGATSVPDAVYDLKGRKLKEIVAPGIYVINRKKILINNM